MVNQFVARDAEMQGLERLLVNTPVPGGRRRNVVIVHGLGGIGKTQLMVEFARKHEHRFSAVFWLDGSSESSLKQSFVTMVQRIPRGELTANDATLLSRATVDADDAVQVCQRWLSVSSNRHWLLLIDNVDRDHRDQKDPQAYNVRKLLADADHGSILITSRLASLERQLGSAGVKLGTVTAEQAHSILEKNAGRQVESKWKAMF
jgi:predicted ATP-dependent serine protease